MINSMSMDLFYINMNFQTFRIFETVNNYYYFAISPINDVELNLSISENWGAVDQDNTINQLFALCFSWVEVKIKKNNISPIELLYKKFDSVDCKTMTVSDEYKI